MKKYQIDTKENERFMKELRDELLCFGKQFPAPGGGAYYLGEDGSPWTDRSIETWITCRMAHVYSIGTLLGHEGSVELAKSAFQGLFGPLKDKKSGGWYAGRTPAGEIVPTKQCYAHAFVILAATSGILAGINGAQELLDDALQIF